MKLSIYMYTYDRSKPFQPDLLTCLPNSVSGMSICAYTLKNNTSKLYSTKSMDHNYAETTIIHACMIHKLLVTLLKINLHAYLGGGREGSVPVFFPL